MMSVRRARSIWLSTNLFCGHADHTHTSRRRVDLSRSLWKRQPECATVAVTEAANRRPSCCTPAILAYSTSRSNSIYHSKPFQRLSHALPTKRQLRGDGPVASGRRGALRGACTLGLSGERNELSTKPVHFHWMCWERPRFHYRTD